MAYICSFKKKLVPTYRLSVMNSSILSSNSCKLIHDFSLLDLIEIIVRLVKILTYVHVHTCLLLTEVYFLLILILESFRHIRQQTPVRKSLKHKEKSGSGSYNPIPQTLPEIAIISRYFFYFGINFSRFQRYMHQELSTHTPSPEKSL